MLKQRKSPGEAEERGKYKGHKDMFGDEGYVHHLNCVRVSQVDTYIKNLSNCTFYIGAVYFKSVISTQSCYNVEKNKPKAKSLPLVR